MMRFAIQRDESSDHPLCVAISVDMNNTLVGDCADGLGGVLDFSRVRMLSVGLLILPLARAAVL